MCFQYLLSFGNIHLEHISVLIAANWTFCLLLQVEDDKFNEFEVWQGLANLYSSLAHWKDVEVCLGKARELKQFSAEILHTEGKNTLFTLKAAFSALVSFFFFW